MKKIILLSALIFSVHFFVSAQIAISSARNLPLGSTVGVSGVVTNGAELGTIRFIQDGTAGIAIFSSSLSSVQRGDEITVTGVTVEYQNLLEIQPVNNWTLNSSGNNLPAPIPLSPLQFGENYESQLVTVSNVAFTNAGGIFQGNTNTNFISNGEPRVIYLRTGRPLVGTTIPGSQVTLTGIISQFANQYQLLLRDTNDISSTSSISIVSTPIPLNISSSGLDINWTTNISGSSILQYGLTPALELGYLFGSGGINHTVSIAGAQPSEVYYAKAISVSGTDTAFSAIKVFITASNSSGDIKIYFNRSVEHSVAHSPSNLAIHINNSLADTIAAYIDRAIQTIDISIYNFSSQGTQIIINAINNAFINGKQIRVISDGGNTNSAIPFLNPGIQVLPSPTGSNYGIMHNKSLILDADAANANLPVVLTGSTNWTNSQINTDRNNMVIIQDKSLAQAYKMEFEEMWGSATAIPNINNSKFGQYKTSNTPQHFIINGIDVETYFSPSDHTNNQLIEKINSSNLSLYFSLLVFTRFDVENAIINRAISGVYTSGMLNDTGNGGSYIFNSIQAAGGNIMLYNHFIQSGILHHKYLIVDQDVNWSDPLVWTGSHNWSTSANTRNDENTLVIHDFDIANQYYQEYVKSFNENGGLLSTGSPLDNQLKGFVYPNPTSGSFLLVFELTDHLSTLITVRDITGRVIYNKNNPGIVGTNYLDLDLNMAPGLYLIEIEVDKSSFRTKLVKNK
ncbi:MAG: phospholipase D-like domain-containing protein [Bacteroidia bacterium]